jgi:hypothetical protein
VVFRPAAPEFLRIRIVSQSPVVRSWQQKILAGPKSALLATLGSCKLLVVSSAQPTAGAKSALLALSSIVGGKMLGWVLEALVVSPAQPTAGPKLALLALSTLLALSPLLVLSPLLALSLIVRGNMLGLVLAALGSCHFVVSSAQPTRLARRQMLELGLAIGN